MTQKNVGQVSVHTLLSETQNYRSSLECLMEVGRSLLSVPSLESSAAEAFQGTAEHILEEAGHQDDLQVVDGVVEPEARIELIMQDVLTPRLHEVESIEKALAEKAEDSVEVPFTTRDAETTAALENLDRKVEILELFGENVRNIKAFISMEGIDIDLVRPMLAKVVSRAGEGAIAFGVSLESVEQTQVIGEMADAVSRIETLVEKAHESASQAAEQARTDAAAIGSEGVDKIGDLIERHRSDNPSGAHLKEGTSVTSVDSGALPKAGDDTGDSSLDDEAAADDMVADAEDDPDAELAVDETADDNDDGDLGPDADIEILADSEVPGDDGDEEVAADTETSPEDAGDQDVEPVVEETGEEEVAENIDDLDDEATEDSNEEDDASEEEEEEDDGVAKASIESIANPVTIETASYRIGDEAIQIRGYVIGMLATLDQHSMLTESGKAALATIQANEGNDFVLTTDMFSERAAEVLVRHYDTWIAAAFRDNDANLRGLSVLLGV